MAFLKYTHNAAGGQWRKDEGGRMKDEVKSSLHSLHPSSFRLHPLTRARARVADGRRDGQLDLDGSVYRVLGDLPRNAGRVGLALKLHRDRRLEAVVLRRQPFERRDAEARVYLAAQGT